MADLNKVRQVKQQHEREWMAREEVVAVGIGKADGETGAGIVISVSENPEKVRKEIKERIEGVPVKIQDTGDFKVQ